jgi:hypothetical protein
LSPNLHLIRFVESAKQVAMNASLALSLALLSVGLIYSGKVAADEAPPEWSLPGHGQSCEFKSRFEQQPKTCGTFRYEAWSCLQTAETKTGQMEKVDYLLVGVYDTDTLNHCSPTYVVKEVIRQN